VREPDAMSALPTPKPTFKTEALAMGFIDLFIYISCLFPTGIKKVESRGVKMSR
jgi:hypothetical protein